MKITIVFSSLFHFDTSIAIGYVLLSNTKRYQQCQIARMENVFKSNLHLNFKYNITTQSYILGDGMAWHIRRSTIYKS